MPINKLAQPLEWCLHQHLATDQPRTDSTPGQTRPGQTSWPLCGYINSANGTPGSQPASLRSFPSIHFLFSPPSLPPPPLYSPFPRPLLVILCLCKCFVRCCCCSLLQMLKNRRSTLSVIQSESQSVGPARAGSQFSMAASLAVWQSVKPEDQPR